MVRKVCKSKKSKRSKKESCSRVVGGGGVGSIRIRGIGYLCMWYTRKKGKMTPAASSSSETALQCNFELIPLQVDTLVSYEAGSSVALIVISLIVSGSVASTLRRSFASQESQDPQVASWSPVTVPTVGSYRMSPFQADPSHCRNFTTGAYYNLNLLSVLSR